MELLEFLKTNRFIQIVLIGFLLLTLIKIIFHFSKYRSSPNWFLESLKIKMLVPGKLVYFYFGQVLLLLYAAVVLVNFFYFPRV